MFLSLLYNMDLVALGGIPSRPYPSRKRSKSTEPLISVSVVGQAALKCARHGLLLRMLMFMPMTVTQNFSAMNASLYTDEAGNWLMNTLFPMALQSDMLFEALVLSMARYFSPTSKDALVPGGTHFVHLRSSVLGKLHRTLSMEEGVSTSDTTIHTVICLIAADVRSASSRSG